MQNEVKKETAKERLAIALPHLFAAFQEAKENGLPTLAIAARQPDGGGKMYMTLNDPEDFLRDIAEVAGVAFELTAAQKLECKAAQFMSKFNRS